ncbi:MAG: hypothetical protein GY716_17220 [bacterium]|nr:hypothetical protein [bacterium]
MTQRLCILAIVLLCGATCVPAATLAVVFTNNGGPLEDPSIGRFYVYDPERPEDHLAWGNAARAATVEDGTYDIVIVYDQDQVQAERKLEAVELAGEMILDADFELAVAKLTLDVTSDGAAVDFRTARYGLHRAGRRGRPLVERRPGRQITILEGVYDVEVTYHTGDGLETRWIEGLVVAGDRYEQLEIGAAVAWLRVEVRENGTLLGGQRGRFSVHRPGREKERLAEAGSGQTLRLPPGAYDIRVFDTGREARSERWLRAVEIRGREDRVVDLGLKQATVRIDVRRRGRRVSRAGFRVYRAGGETPVAAGRSGDSIELDEGRYDVRCFHRNGSLRAESWLRDQEIVGDTRLTVELELRRVELRVRPSGRFDPRDSTLHVVLDSSADMGTRLDSRTRMETAAQGLSRAVQELGGDKLELGLRAFGIAPLSRHNCRDSTLLIPPAPLDRRTTASTLQLLRPTGHAAIAYALEQAADDLSPARRNTMLLLTGSVERCDGEPCAVAARLLREGRIERLHVIGLGLNDNRTAELRCAGEFHGVGSERELRAALGRILDEAARAETGSVSVLTAGGREWVAGGALDSSIELAAGTYDVVIHDGGRTHMWKNLHIDEDLDAIAGPTPPSE